MRMPQCYFRVDASQQMSRQGKKVEAKNWPKSR
jgi:hypothetical protein